MNISKEILCFLDVLENKKLIDIEEINLINQLVRQAHDIQKRAADILVKSAAAISTEDESLQYMIDESCFALENFDSLSEKSDLLQQQFLEGREREQANISALGPSGFTFTNGEVHRIAGEIVSKVRKGAGNLPLIARVWPYRHDELQMISFDFFTGEDSGSLAFTHCVTASGMLSGAVTDEPCVFDMVEAMHLVSLVVRGLDAKVILGRTANELNTDLLSQPLSIGQTSGHISLWEV